MPIHRTKVGTRRKQCAFCSCENSWLQLLSDQFQNKTANHCVIIFRYRVKRPNYIESTIQ